MFFDFLVGKRVFLIYLTYYPSVYTSTLIATKFKLAYSCLYIEISIKMHKMQNSLPDTIDHQPQNPPSSTNYLLTFPLLARPCELILEITDHLDDQSAKRLASTNVSLDALSAEMA
jgi:hypothetical protein